MRVVSHSNIQYTPHYRRYGLLLFIASHTEPELKTTKGRDSAVMYISNRAYLSTT